ncbi:MULTISPECIES: ABC transporter permease [unclassified Campylobacter]|uniref:ABC transporter permease n=1 Tax=unclassified Campylobacter TaxID=2593542 RepID=UPI0012381D99|nr:MULTISPECIES: ABC transporter permease [unclassified Campylobacter]KAA6227241.1 ABC transporter permease [Campylobacter sp. LR286c]KAA8604426.1 ABC transporter permease [Campylobacter sp. LR185c]
MLFLIEKEFKQFFRNKFFPKMIFVFPLMIILVMPWAATLEVKNIYIGVLDNDKSMLSKDLITKIKASDYFILSKHLQDKEEANRCIYENKCDIILEFPLNFEKDFLKAKNANLALYANAINSTKGSLGNGYLNNIILEFSNEKASQGQKVTINNTQILSTYRFNANLDYKQYMIPALMVMVLTLICGFLPAFNIVLEKEKGNIEQINVTPISKFQFILSKLIPYWIIGLLVVSLCFILAFLVYGLLPKGSFLLIYLFVFVYILVITGFGLVISNYSNTLQQAMFVTYFFILILILLSGLMTSIKSMPLWAQNITFLNPLRYFIEALRLIYLKGSGISNLWPNLLILLAFAFIFCLWAILGYKKRN